MKRSLLIGALFLMLVLSPAMASAAYLYDFEVVNPFESGFFYTNDFETNSVEFRISGDAEITFGGYASYAYTLGADNSVEWWTYEADPSLQTITFTSTNGSAAESEGSFYFYIWDGGFYDGILDNFDFTLSWTEYPLGGGEAGSGSVTFVDGIPTPTPLPASVWLLLSGLGLFVGIRRHRAD